MRTTVILDDRLFREAKRRAASRGITLSELISEALRVAMTRTASTAREYSIATYGAGRTVHHEPGDFAAADEQEDRQRLGK